MLNLVLYTVFYALAFLLSVLKIPFLSGILLMGMAVYLYVFDYLRIRSLFHLRGLFCLSFVGGQGLSLLQLSHLQTDWNGVTWICFYLAVFAFYGVYEFLSHRFGRIDRKSRRRNGMNQNAGRLLFCITLLSLLSLSAFVFEALVLGFIPLFVRGVPHAYSAFHITGVHYFTVSCVLVPALCLVYIHQNEPKKGELWFVLILALISVLIPVLCVSRFQLLFAVLLAVITFVLLNDNRNSKVLLYSIPVILPVYLILTVARSHDSTYLNSIFEMKYGIPVFIAQPYIYIANNYDNFNRMVLELPRFTFGQKMLFPVFALSGLKFAFPGLVDLPIYVTKKELTTLTLFYDAYYDFGVLGVALFSAFLGFLSYIIEDRIRESKNRISLVFYAQLCIYFALSFFTTWFTNPTTWFYFVVTMIIYWFCRNDNTYKKNDSFRKRSI